MNIQVYVSSVSTGGMVESSALSRHNRDSGKGNIIKSSPMKGQQVHQKSLATGIPKQFGRW